MLVGSLETVQSLAKMPVRCVQEAHGYLFWLCGVG